MDHSIPLITTVAVAFGLALILGFVAVRLKLPALVGYLVAGIAIGPATPGFVADVQLSQQLAEIGVMLLMFGVGLHFSLDDLMAVWKIAVLGKSIAAFFIVLAFRYPLNTALTVSASLAQIGEFSFILAGMGLSLKLLPPEGQHLILVGALISMAVNPLVFAAVEPLQKWIRARSAFARRLDLSDDPLAALPMTVDQALLHQHVVLVGYGRVGARIGESLRERRIPFVVAEQNRELVEQLRARGIQAVSGDAAEPVVLIQAHIARARMLVIATPDTFRARKMIEIARTLKPDIDTVVRTHSDEEADLLKGENAGRVFMGEHELASGMFRYIHERMDQQPH